MKKIVLVFLGLISFIMPLLVFSQQYQTPGCGPQQGSSDYILCSPIPGINQRQTDFASFIRQVYQLALAAGGTLVFLRVVYGAILYTTSGVIDKKREARKIISWAFGGLALLMGSYLVLYTINPSLVQLRLPNEPYFSDATQLKKYNTFITHETENMRREDREAHQTLLFIQDEVEALQQTPNRTPEQETRLTELQNRLPEATANFNIKRRDLSSHQLNIINDQIAELEARRGEVRGGGLFRVSQWGWLPKSVFGTPSGLPLEDERRLQNLYERRESFIKQQRQANDHFR